MRNCRKVGGIKTLIKYAILSVYIKYGVKEEYFI